MKALVVGLMTVAATAGTATAQYVPYGSPPGPYGSQGTMGSPGTNGYGYGIGSNPNAHAVAPYETRQGTYVQPHMQTNPNSTQMDNYSARGNLNPYNGQVGTRMPRY